MGGCTSKYARLPDDQTAVSTSAAQKQPAVESASTDLGSSNDLPSEAQIATEEVSTKPVTKTGATRAQHEVRTVMVDAPGFDRDGEIVTGVISLDEGNSAVRQQPDMNNASVFDKSAQPSSQPAPFCCCYRCCCCCYCR